ncbi:uncharacterized protein I206_105096 [Kwoniella pini CBS 10737]|uniref:Uncharacterized protein n=1 Tax=Kwoniella pini CBS 10737 TaxID=1296096 RepID=A0A1B9I8T1_9TREE|nr:uncharacterized protein I206_02636 [Kwoniella pini CBS 10737]OCF51920.1 hypothetical protein I206_02636 [Kwoniella pini CBS 10737]
MVFSLPSLPSGILGGLIDTSPQVFYPPTRNTPTKPSRARSTSKSSVRSNIDSPSGQLIPLPSPTVTPLGQNQNVGNLLPASASVKDLTGDWEPLVSGGIAGNKRVSIGSDLSAEYGGRSCSSPSTAKTPTRPNHRRSQSAQPATLSSPNSQYSLPPPPTGKLQEFSKSRNSLASTSAISLPTLIEGELDGPGQTSKRSMPPSPLIRPFGARKISPVSPSMKSDLTLEEESDEDGDIPKLKFVKSSLGRANSTSSVPPPLVNRSTPDGYFTMPPPSLNSINITYSPSSEAQNKSTAKPLLSPRSWSVQDIHSLSNHPAKDSYSRRGSISSTSSVSDIAVLATWSFPNAITSTKDKRGQGDDVPERGRKPGHSERLKERLKNIPGIETGPLPISGSLPNVNSPNHKLSSDGNSIIRPSRPLPSYLRSGHRHTHSSPNLLTIPRTSTPNRSGTMGPPALPTSPSNSLLPPPKPVQRRPTTSRLRQPNPLSMPIKNLHRSQSQNSTSSGRKILGSSPDSTTSSSEDSTLCPSPTTSIKSLSSLNVQSDSDDGLSKDDTSKAWWSFGHFNKRGQSQSTEIDLGTTKKGIGVDGEDGIEILSNLSNLTESDWDSNHTEDTEDYIDLENM